MTERVVGRQVESRRWGVLLGLAGVAAVVALGPVDHRDSNVALATDSNEVGAAPKDKHAAAHFLGVEPDELTVGQQGWVTAEVDSWGVLRTRMWELNIQKPDGQLSRVASAVVDIDDDLVVRALWNSERYWRGTGRERGEEALSREKCRLVAVNFLWQKVPFFSWPQHLKFYRVREEFDVKGFAFQWFGSTSRLREASVNITVSSASGRVVQYFLSRVAQPPAPVSEIKVTRSEAERIIRDYVPEETKVLSVTVRWPWTLSPFAPRGEPVYMVGLKGRRPLPEDPDSRYVFAAGYGVHATTGGVLTETREEWGEPLESWSEKIDDETRLRVKLNGSDAKDILRDHLPGDWLNPSVSIRTLSSDTRFALDGEPVYTMHVSYEKETAAGGTTQMRTVCGVHAVSGEVFGVPQAGEEAEEEPGEAPNE